MEELKNFDPFNPTEEHQALRNMVRAFTVEQVDGQRLEQ
jgi:flagellar hook assembly protein FlgD|tara:strand:+ start:324 stop:440 length:117 start_codon:yes stop_codon:yes gene_type:complete